MGSVRSTFHAVATSSCRGRAAFWHSHGTSTRAGQTGDPLGTCAHPPHASAAEGAPGTHIEETDVHVEVDVHVIDGPVLPVKTRGAVAWGAGTVLEQWPGAHRARVGRLMGQ